jgi:hypothetical protein
MASVAPLIQTTVRCSLEFLLAHPQGGLIRSPSLTSKIKKGARRSERPSIGNLAMLLAMRHEVFNSGDYGHRAVAVQVAVG